MNWNWFKSETTKCGCELNYMNVELWNEMHDSYIFDGDEHGKGRYRKIVCKNTGGWWKIPLPDLHEIT